MGAPDKQPAKRVTALRRFAIAITVLNILGHTLLGFEPSWAQPFVALVAAYGTETLIELLVAASRKRRPRFLGDPAQVIDFYLPAHITGLACAMLLYPGEQLMAVAFAAAVAIASKARVRVRVGESERHVLNPSNFGITCTLLLFPWVGITQPYQYTETISGAWDLLLPCVVIVTGSLLNAKFTLRMPLILGWVGGFAAQAVLRAVLFDTPLIAGLVPMTGFAFVLFTFYMVTDPGTTPSDTRCQVLFGLSVALLYGILMAAHVVFTLFFALTIVCVARGLSIYLWNLAPQTTRTRVAAAANAVLVGTRP